MWEPRRLTNLWASTACYRGSVTFYWQWYAWNCSSNTMLLPVPSQSEWPSALLLYLGVKPWRFVHAFYERKYSLRAECNAVGINDNCYNWKAKSWCLACRSRRNGWKFIRHFINGSTALSWALAAFFSFVFLYTVGRILWTGDKPVARPLPTNRTTQTQNKRTQIPMPRMGFEPTISVFERAKRVHASDRTAAMIGNG
jgi:hypothetical protein